MIRTELSTAMNAQKRKLDRRELRAKRTRGSLFGTPERPRLSVYRSLKHIYAQLIDDHTGKTLAMVTSTSAEVRGAELKNGGNIAAAKKIGLAIAQKAKSIGVTKVAFDRGGRMYHGRIKALADAAREGGLKF